jgi:hypothetical protein
MSRSRASSTAFGAGAKQRPLGDRPPPLNWGLIGLRLLIVACALLWAARAPLLGWADSVPLPPASPADSPAVPALPLERVATIGAQVVRTVLRPPVATAIWGVALAGLGAVALELSLAAARLVVQSLAQRRAGGLTLRIRLPLTSGPRGVSTSGRDPGGDLLRAVHELLPAQGGPWLALTLGAHPDEPAELGMFIGGGSARQRETWAAALRKVIGGIAPEALIELTPDPLAAALEPGRLVAWRTWLPAQPPAYPLRLASDSERSDLLGPLAAAVAPRVGTRYGEVQIILRPRRDWELAQGWRAGALRRLLRLKGRHERALGPDARALEAKLAGPVYDATIRAVAVGESRADRQATLAELDEIGAALGQYAARSGSRLQRLSRAGGGMVVVPRRRRWVDAAGLVGAGLLGGLIFQLRAMPPSVPALPFGSLPGVLVALVVALLGLTVAQRWSGQAATSRLRQLQLRAPRLAPPPPVVWPLRAWRAPGILAPIELGGLWHLPTPALGRLVRWLPCRQLPAPPHAFVDGAAERLVVGSARRSNGQLVGVGPSLRDLRQVLHLTAGMGAGKSRFLANLCRQLLPHGLTLIDGKGDDEAGSLVATVRRLIPREDEARLVILDVLDTDWPIGLNPLAGVALQQAGGADLAVGQVLATFARLDPATWGKAMGMQHFAQMATLLVLEGEPQPTLAHIKQALLDEGYRRRLLTRAGNIEVRTFWEQTFAALAEGQRVSREALLRRLDLLLATETTRSLITQPRPSFRFEQAITERWIVLIPLPDMTLGGLAGAIGMLLFQAFIRAAFARQGSDQDRASYPLVVDELQVLIGDGVSESADVRTAITRLRALGIPTIYAHQALAQLGDLAPLMLINAANRLILQTQELDASVYARAYAAAGLTAADISGQDPNSHQYAVLRCDGQPAGPFSIQPLPWPAPLSADAPPEPASDWQAVLPAEPDPADERILALVYGGLPNPSIAVAELARLGDEAWAELTGRWDAIRQAQRAHILAHPGCIRDRLERQRWLSRLTAATPRIFAAAAYQRQRWALDPRETPQPLRPFREQRGAERAESDRPSPVAIISGLAPSPGETPPPPAVTALAPASDLLRARGRRRAKDDIAPGFEFEPARAADETEEAV